MGPRAATAICKARTLRHKGPQEYATYILVPEVLLSHLLDLLSCHSINGVFNLLWGYTVTGGDELLANVFCDCSCSIKAEKQASLELALGAFNFNVHQSCQHSTGPLLEHEVSHVIEVHEVLQDQIDTPETSVGVWGREWHEAISKIIWGNNVRKTGWKERSSTKWLVPVAHDGLHHKHGEVVWWAPANVLYCNCNMCIQNIVILDVNLRTNKLLDCKWARWPRGIGLEEMGREEKCFSAKVMSSSWLMPPAPTCTMWSAV